MGVTSKESIPLNAEILARVVRRPQYMYNDEDPGDPKLRCAFKQGRDKAGAVEECYAPTLLACGACFKRSGQFFIHPRSLFDGAEVFKFYENVLLYLYRGEDDGTASWEFAAISMLLPAEVSESEFGEALNDYRQKVWRWLRRKQARPAAPGNPSTLAQ